MKYIFNYKQYLDDKLSFEFLVSELLKLLYNSIIESLTKEFKV